MVTLPMTLGDH